MTNSLHEGFVDHLPYEMWMLAGTYDALRTEHPEIIKNALIESFSIHARQLIDFFENKKFEDDLKAREFTGGHYAAVHVPQIALSTRTKLNKQIAHLTKSRTTDQTKKIGLSDRNEILSAIVAEYQNFCTKLTSEYRALLKPSTLVVDVGGRPGATNQSSSTTSTLTEIGSPTGAPNTVEKDELPKSPKEES